MQQGRIWMLTIPQYSYMPYKPPGVAFIRGQLEQGAGGYLHWQLLVWCERSRRKHWLIDCFGRTAHCELSRSARADAYVWKDDTAVNGTRFELGEKPIRRNSKTDWDIVRRQALAGDLLAIDSNIFVSHYRSLRAIASDYAEPVAVDKEVYVFWGRTGTGKSRRAWDEAGMDAYCKDPRSKFWCGYRGQTNVVMDEFRGGIDIAHLLRWLDRYPVHVELKGSSTPLVSKKIWITSNLHPRDWYKDLDEETVNALLRRINITHFDAL